MADYTYYQTENETWITEVSEPRPADADELQVGACGYIADDCCDWFESTPEKRDDAGDDDDPNPNPPAG